MAKKAEASLILKIATKGKESIKQVGSAFKDLGSTIVENAKTAAISLGAIGTAISALAVKAGKFEQVQASFEKLTASQGKNADEILAKMKELTDGMVSEMDLMAASNKAILLGLPVDKFPEMLKIAKSASEATGESMQFMLDSIVTGLGRQSKLILDNLGIIIDLEKAYDKYAKTLGKSSKELTETEKKQAFINEAMEVGMDNAKKMTDENETANKSWQRMKVAVEETSIAIGKELTPLVQVLFNELLDFINLGKEFAQSNFLLSAVEAVSKGLVVVTDTFKKAGVGLKSLGATAELVWSKITFDKENAKKSEKELEDLNKRYEQISVESGKKLNDIDEKFARKRALKNTEIAKEEETKKQEALKQIGIEAKKARLEEEKRLEDEKAVEQAEKQAQKDANLIEIMRTRREEYEQWKLDHALKKAEEQKKIQEQMEKEQLDRNKELAGHISGFLSSGFQGAAASAVGAFTDTLLPGFGGAASQMFNLLSQDSDQFVDTLNQLFSTEFLENIAKNIPIFFEQLVDKLPDFVSKLIEVLIANSPEIAIAITKSLSDPNFILAVTEAFAEGIAKGLKKALKDAGENIKDAFSIGGGGGDGGGVGGAISAVGSALGFNSGGMVPNVQKFANGGTVDTVPAMLTPGEFVINRDAAQRNLPLLQSINAGGGGGGTTVVNLTVNGGLMGDAQQAREFARAIDKELLSMRRDNESLSFDTAVF